MGSVLTKKHPAAAAHGLPRGEDVQTVVAKTWLDIRLDLRSALRTSRPCQTICAVRPPNIYEPVQSLRTCTASTRSSTASLQLPVATVYTVTRAPHMWISYPRATRLRRRFTTSSR